MQTEQRPKVGVAIFIRKNNTVLIGKRIGKHATGTWGAPGGHLEFGESFEDCALREMREEVGTDLQVTKPKFWTATNDIFQDVQKHYITIAMLADYISGEIQNMEPEKCERWEWRSWDDLPSPLMLPVQNIVNLGVNPFTV